MDFLIGLLLKTLGQVWLTFSHNWPYLLFGSLVAVWLKLYVDAEKVRQWLLRNQKSSILASIGVAVGTPLCSCGTTAVVLGMLASTMPWAPIVAFMVSSPLTSPEELFYSSGLFGWPFALTYFAASIILGLVGGIAASILEARGYLANQARLKPIMGGSVDSPSEALHMSSAVAAPHARPGLREFVVELWPIARRLLILFLTFAFVGYLLNNLIPSSAIIALFGTGNRWGVPLAATLGIPLYFNSEASLPLVKAFMDNGASAGATLAFLITGAGTSVGAIVGALTIARWRIVALVVGTLWIGAMLFGYAYNQLLILHLI